MNRRIIIRILAIGLVFTSCKIKQTALDTGLKMPNSFSAVTDSINVDSVSRTDGVTVENWETFFTDDKLKHLLRIGLENNFDARTAYQNIQMARSQMVLTKGIQFPDLGIGVETGVRKYGKYTEDGVGNEGTSVPNPIPTFNLFLSTSWEIDILGKLHNKRKASFFQFLATEEARKLMFTQIISEIAESYYNLMLLDQQIKIYEENSALQEKAVEIVQFQKEGGKVTELAVELIKAQYLATKSFLIDLEKAVINEEKRLNILVGRYPQPIARNTFNPSEQITQLLEVGVPSELLLNRPDIRAAEQQIRAEKANLKAAQLAFYPSLTINAKIGMDAFQIDKWFNPTSLAFDALGGLFAPLLNRRALKHELLNAKAHKAIAYIAYEQTIVTAFSEVWELMKTIALTNEQITLTSEQVQILDSSIATSQTLFASGRAGYIEILTAQENYLQALNKLQDLQRLKNHLSIRLYKALGGGV